MRVLWLDVFEGLMIPFLGTVLGSACVFFMKKELSRNIQRALTGFAGGVMVAASIWSLLIPAMNLSEDKGKLAFLPAFIGFWLGILFLLTFGVSLLVGWMVARKNKNIDMVEALKNAE